MVLRTSKDGKGKFGRILGEIFVPGVVQSVNQLLIEEGHAVKYFGGKKPIKKKIDLDHIPQGPL